MPKTGSGGTSGNTKWREELNLVIVGDRGCGKTSLLMAYTKGEFPETYVQTVFDKSAFDMKYRGGEIHLNLYDTAGNEDYDRLRPLSYQNADVVLICYDVTSSSSFENVLLKWYPEVHHFCRGVPIILVGCKTDLRKDKDHCRKLWALGKNLVTYIQGEETKRQIKAELYMECSAKQRENVEDIFREAIKRTLAISQRLAISQPMRTGSCALL